jgi:ABC-2 type transport system permease protein
VLGDTAGQVGLEAAVGSGTGVTLLTVVTVAATACAGRRLQSLRLTNDP